MRKIGSTLLLLILLCVSGNDLFAQKKNAVFQSGERLTYKVKFGFVKLGTLVFETGSYLGNSHIKTRMKFWTAQVPFLDSKDTLDDITDTSGICVINFDERGYDGEKKFSHAFSYEPSRRTMTICDASAVKKVTSDVRPFSDAISLFFNLRTWSGSAANYFFPVRGSAGEKLVKCCFSRAEEKQKCPAFKNAEIATYRIDGVADVGNNTLLGANGKFTAFVTEDEAAIPVRIDMSIAIGSITILLEKAERADWEPITENEK